MVSENGKSMSREVVIPRPMYCPKCKGEKWRVFIDADDPHCWLITCPNCKEACQISVDKMSPTFPLSSLQDDIPRALVEAEFTRVLKQIHG